MSAGLRWESNRQVLTSKGVKNTSGKVTNLFKQLLPSLNVSYQFSEQSLIRGAYFRSWNRPEFREIAPFGFYDFDNEWYTYGYESLEIADVSDLQTPTINNLDLRWEWYPSINELVMFGVFYKFFKNPIELVVDDTQTSSPTLAFRNSKSSESLGVEVEIRKSIPLNVQNTHLLSVNTNVAYIKNTVNNSNLPEQVQRRPMMNQSPYLINLGLFFENQAYDYKIGAFYNVFGSRLVFASEREGTLPDMYELPRHELDISLFKNFGERWEIKLGILNFLDAPVRFYQDSNADGQINTSVDERRFYFRRGQQFTLAISTRF